MTDQTDTDALVERSRYIFRSYDMGQNNVHDRQILRDSIAHITTQAAQIAALTEALREVNRWIDGWSPDFIMDDEWPDTQAKIDAALNFAPKEKEL